MPSRGSALAVAVASTTFSPMRTTAAPWACLANFPVSNESCFPPVRSTVTVLTSGFIFHPSYRDQACRSGERSRFRVANVGLPIVVQSSLFNHGRRVRPWDERVPQELGRPPKIRTVELAQCRTGFGRKAVVSEICSENILGGRSDLTFPLLAKNARNGAPRFVSHAYLRMPSFPMTVL